MVSNIDVKHFHLFCGLGGGARGFNRGEARVGTQHARFRCLGGVDVDPAAITDFEHLSGARGTVLDLFTREQYVAFHGHEPPSDWMEATPADIRRAAGGESPHIVFTSPPCKGLSGLLSETKSRSPQYQALNALTLRGTWLCLEAFADDPPEFFLFENVPRIQNRGRHLLDEIQQILRHYGYAVAETTHDCGELGGLAQSRKRFLLVGRHVEKVPPFLYEPFKKPLRAVGEVIEKFPLPGDPTGGTMHRVPALQWKTWVRLAFVEAGRDWRSLNRLTVADGVLADYLLVPEMRNCTLGVLNWQDVSGTVTGNARPATGTFSIADPRIEGHPKSVQMGVRRWDESARVVTGKMLAGGGPNSIADPRYTPTHPNNIYRVVRVPPDGMELTSDEGRSAGARPIADPRPGMTRAPGDAYRTAGHYGVVPWDTPSYAITGSGRHDNGYHNIADPRLPAANEHVVAVIRAEDDTWHRPFTTLELAALQGLVDPEEHVELQGLSDGAWRERIGNAVPPPAAQAIAGVMGQTLLLAWSGETFVLSAQPIWVRPLAIAASVDVGRGAA